jgi:SlyX protein
MNETIDRIEIKIAYLEKANAELSDVVYRQGREIEALDAKLLALVARFEATQEQADQSPSLDEQPPHY